MRSQRTAVLFFTLFAGALALAHWPPSSARVAAQGRASNSGAAIPAFRVIVNAANPHGWLDRDFVADAFLIKVSRWNDGQPIRPVDLRGDSVTRRKFSNDVLRRSIAAVRNYWQQLIFSGRGLPPPELDSDADVIKFVVRNRGAIGYVSGAAELGAARAVMVE